MTWRWVLAVLLTATMGGGVDAAEKKLLKGALEESRTKIIEAERRYIGYSSQKDASGKERIGKIFLGTKASYSPLREGDTIVDERFEELPKGLVAHLTVQREGKKFALDLDSPGNYRKYLNADVTAAEDKQQPMRRPTSVENKVNLVAIPAKSAPIEGSVEDSAAKLKAQAEKVFRGRDLVVLIDRSGSMSTSDCPGAMSRWDWCKQQVVSLSEATRAIFPAGFRLGLYNNHCNFSDNADVDSIVKAFNSFKPDGGTYTADAITHEIREYRDRKRHGGTKPIVIAVVTDGAPSSPSGLRDVLVNATMGMERADELQVVFIQIGEDDQATTLLEQLEGNLTHAGARFAIVHCVGFDKVKGNGLLRAIAETLTGN